MTTDALPLAANRITLADARIDSQTRLQGRWLLLARAAWVILIVLALLLFSIAIPAMFTASVQQALTTERNGLAKLGMSVEGYATLRTGLALAATLISVVIGVFLFWRRSDDWMVLLVSFVFITVAPGTEIALGTLGVTQPVWLVPVLLQFGMGLIATTLLVFTFPTGRFVPSWTRPTFILFAIGVFAYGGANIVQHSLSDPASEWIVCYSLGFIAQIYRQRRVTSAIQRQQFRWIVFGFFIYAPTFVMFSLLNALVIPTLPGAQRILFGLWGTLFLFYVPAVFLFATAVFATLRYRLWDIDLLINRTLVYVPLTAILAGIFAASITLSQKLSAAITGQSSDAATVLTTLIVVAAFTPIKERLQTLVDSRFREAPDAIKELKAFGEHVRLRVSPVENRQIMRRLVDVAVKAFGAIGGAAYWGTDPPADPIYTSGEWKNEVGLSAPLETNGKKLGTVSLCARRSGAGYTALEREALRETAEVVAVAIDQDGKGDTG